MVPEPTANPHARLVTECFQECPAFETSARNWSPTTPPASSLVRGPHWGDAEGPVIDKGEDHSPEVKVVDLWFDDGYKETDLPPSSWGYLAGPAGHGGDPIGQGQQTAVVEYMIKRGSVRGCTLPSLKDLGLDMYLEKRTENGSQSAFIGRGRY